MTVKEYVFDNFRFERGAGKLKVTVRYDGKYSNGHNTFSITGTLYRDDAAVASGAIHEDIQKYAPELAYLIKWHLMTSEGPMHDIADTTYLAGTRDCNGLLKGERKQIIAGSTGLPCWHLQTLIDGQCRDVRIEGYKNQINCKSDELPIAPEGMFWGKWCRVGEGRVPDLKGARKAAIWPDATLEQLQDPEQLKARLPTLMEEFKEVLASLDIPF